MPAFRRVLIANRGEIAVRVIRALRAMRIESVAVFSDADVTWPHPAMADMAVRLDGSYPVDTYLNIHKIVEAATSIGCDAIHPGYGFLSESSDFSRACRDSGIKFIGPSPETLQVSGNKLACKNLAEENGVPVVPYTREPIEDVEEAVRFSSEIGFPVLLKSAFGGGGRGIREARSKEEVRDTFSSAQREAKASFGKFAIFIEKRLKSPRHIEVQVVASDDSKEFIHLGERDCSIQRRYQKLIEMSPSPVIDEESRNRVTSHALAVARAVGYSNAGTAEFLRDTEGNFYFMEINSRLQVEHPVTELVTGIDIVKTQIAIASGTRIPFGQKDVHIRGCAIECRINAEDPLHNFAPTTGQIEYLTIPGGPGIRVDTALELGVDISPFYDSLVAKLLAHGRDFEEARERELVALEEFVIAGIETTIPFHKAVLNNERFARGDFDTGFLEAIDLSKEMVPKVLDDYFVIAALLLSKNQFVHNKASELRSKKVPRWLTSQSSGRFIDGI
jgi:acetyl-CoA/propionyl-CoA carboxylase